MLMTIDKETYIFREIFPYPPDKTASRSWISNKSSEFFGAKFNKRNTKQKLIK